MARGRGINGGDVVLFAMPGAQGGVVGLTNGGAPTGAGVGAAAGALSGERLLRRQVAQETLVAYFKQQAVAAADRAGAAGPASGGASGADCETRGSGESAAVPPRVDEPDGDGDAECPICLEPLSASEVRARA
jgi:hypothetical protein